MFIYFFNTDESTLEKEMKNTKSAIHYLDAEFKSLELGKILTTDKFVYIKAVLEEYKDILKVEHVKKKTNSPGLAKILAWLIDITHDLLS